MRKKNYGFTLVELLAVIAILGIVVSITVFVSIKSINKAKEKSYKTTINNIERMAGTYLEENGDRLFYISKNDGTNIEYQCITIENLIDGGYFKNDVLNSQVSKDDKVKESDYVYLERNGITKSVIKNVYVLNGEDDGVCPSAVKAESDITFLVEPQEWSKTKEITITYKLKNVNNINNYEYLYSYNNDNIELISDNGNLKKVRVLGNGTLRGIIKYLGEESYSKELVINKIDTVGPVISLGNNMKGYVKEKTDVYLKVSDDGIGVDNNSFTRNDIIVSVGDKEISQENLALTLDNNDSFKLVINNKMLDGNVKVKIKAGGILDKLGNGNDEVILDTGIIFDNTAPSKPEINNPSGGEWTNKNIKLDLSTIENGSGVDYWQYTYNESANSVGNDHNTNWVTYSNSSSINYTTGEFSQEREQLVYVRACDKLGNCSDKNSTYIKIDKKAPTCNLSVSGTTITATFQDNDGGSGINGEYSKTATINSVNNYVFTGEDYAGNSKSCSVGVIGTSSSSTYTCRASCVNGNCYEQYCKGGKYICDDPTGLTGCGNKACCDSVGGRWYFYCNRGYGTRLKSTPCSSGWSYSDGACYKYKQSSCSGGSVVGTNTTYYCPSGYTKINDSYCYNINY